ncbi:hypothetical protein TRIUR3_30085 [Triticum urartu]|uniref:Protein MOTHER of FT and TF 1 n=2 Tax=Triticinae TaxID=1648030 RepID=M7YWP4_TRIUA|nr:hypothetical protein TRIUR3_30085 [Triticum urartu]
MAAHVDPLVVGRVIGDVVDMFVPTMPVTVRFGTKDLTNGCEIKPSIADAAPSIQIAGRAGDLFTLVMTDPDAPSPSEPTMKEWLHWLVVNIPGGSDPSQGEEVVPYMGPKPPLGIHRYVLIYFLDSQPCARDIRVVVAVCVLHFWKVLSILGRSRQLEVESLKGDACHIISRPGGRADDPHDDLLVGCVVEAHNAKMGCFRRPGSYSKTWSEGNMP